MDNGTHLMIGGYHATLDLLRRASGEDLLLFQDELWLEWIDERGVSALDCPPLAAPLHLLVGLLGLRLPLSVKLQAIRLGLAVRFGRRPDGLTLAEYLGRCGQGEAARRLLWDPLAIAILNESVERAAAVLFHRVYREAFLRRSSRLAPRLSAPRLGRAAREAGRLFREPGRRRPPRRPSRIARVRDGTRERRAAGAAARGARGDRRGGAGGASRACCRRGDQRRAAARAARDACPSSCARGRRSEALERFSGSPIVSVDLWLDRVVVDRPMLGLRDAEMEWVFDKGRLHGRAGAPQHLAFIASAAYRSAPKPNAELVAAAVGALRRYFPAMADAVVTRSLVQREPQATFASTPELEGLRPGPVSEVPGLFLAGDWTDTGLPATIEGAVRSGQRAAEALLTAR